MGTFQNEQPLTDLVLFLDYDDVGATISQNKLVDRFAVCWIKADCLKFQYVIQLKLHVRFWTIFWA